MKIQYPGLNAPIHDDAALKPIEIKESFEDELKEASLSVRKTLEETGMSSKRRRRDKLHPLERGFSGHQVVGQKLGPPPPVGDVSMEDFQTYCLEVSI